MFCNHQLLVSVTRIRGEKAAWFNITIRQGGIVRKYTETIKESEKKREEINVI